MTKRIVVSSARKLVLCACLVTVFSAIASQFETRQTNALPVALRLTPADRVLAAQMALARLGLSPGSLDGLMGPKTRGALKVYQCREGLPITDELDPMTLVRLVTEEPSFGEYTVSSNDLARLRPLQKTWLGKSQQDRLDYETVLELVAEQSLSNPKLIMQLNPAVDWTNIAAGVTLKVPKVSPRRFDAKAAFVRIYLSERVLHAYDERTNLMVHFPCSVARQVDKRPAGELHVVSTAANPTYTFNPEIFPESPEARELGRRLVLPPGPNNPVGTIWIGLDAPGYGIHGTPRPEDVGRAETHGCFRLANWNAELLAQLVSVGTPVLIEP